MTDVGNKTSTDSKSHIGKVEEISRLTGQLAHEIKNPLSVIKINLKLIDEDLQGLNRAVADKTDTKNTQELQRALKKVDIVRKETSRLQQILDSFLQYIGRTELQLSRVDISRLVGEMIDFYSPQAYKHSITVREGLVREPIVCKVDEGMLKQVILNLFINAQQAMDNGGELMVRTYKHRADAVIQVSDTGSGISDDKLSKIFDAFYSFRPGGKGLGLATAKRIIEAHNGKITVDSEPGKGTSFTIRLPLCA
ncbi:MAG: hypothetical protein JXB29_12825 [Sedimentisphaerales bacterium]|nr:hypothetical protein [Sedimentisphaerales bacterium]